MFQTLARFFQDECGIELSNPSEFISQDGDGDETEQGSECHDISICDGQACLEPDENRRGSELFDMNADDELACEEEGFGRNLDGGDDEENYPSVL